MTDLQLITLDPGHFHAALVQKEMLPGIARQVHVYAPLGPDLLAHLQRIAGFNSRAERPTSWELEVHAGPDYLTSGGAIARPTKAPRAGLHPCQHRAI